MILYYTHKNYDNSNIIKYCFDRIVKQAQDAGQPLIAVVPDEFQSAHKELFYIRHNKKTGDDIKDIYYRILLGLNYAESSELVYLAEHDVLYSNDYFELKTEFGYNLNYTYLSKYGFFQRHVNCLALSQLIGTKNKIKQGAEELLHKIENNKFTCYEPSQNLQNVRSINPSVDVRHDFNASWHVDKLKDKFWQEIPNNDYWESAGKLWKEINKEKTK